MAQSISLARGKIRLCSWERPLRRGVASFSTRPTHRSLPWERSLRAAAHNHAGSPGTNVAAAFPASAAIYLAGQFSHSVNGAGNSYAIQLTRFLMQRTISGGEFTKANFTVNDSAFIECPDDSVDFEDGDNVALYLVGGTHNFTNTLFGWTKDDGIDSGGTDDSTSGQARINYQSCWFEATFHEGNSLSGYKNISSRDTVYFDCGQG